VIRGQGFLLQLGRPATNLGVLTAGHLPHSRKGRLNHLLQGRTTLLSLPGLAAPPFPADLIDGFRGGVHSPRQGRQHAEGQQPNHPKESYHGAPSASFSGRDRFLLCHATCRLPAGQLPRHKAIITMTASPLPTRSGTRWLESWQAGGTPLKLVG